MNKAIELIDKLSIQHSLTLEEYKYLIDNRNDAVSDYLRDKAEKLRQEVYGNKVYIRGLIEFSNICKNNCLYCGIQSSNKNCERYRLTKEEILECCKEGYILGFRTFVLQGGEDMYFDDDILCDIVSSIRNRYPDCAITLSIGERTKESYQRLFEAGANRYLLRHETADQDHYEKLHPDSMSYKHRMQCLKDLKEIGYQVGCGFMVESPYQNSDTLSKDLKFIEEFKPEMCGIGPFIPHHETIFKDEKPGSLDLTCYLLSIIRLIHPPILLPATTALGTIHPKGREMGILAGANVLMPNLSPTNVRKKYELYDNKICAGDEAAECRMCLTRRIKSIGYEIIVDRGDFKKEGNSNV